jgi:hypothetical protein
MRTLTAAVVATFLCVGVARGADFAFDGAKSGPRGEVRDAQVELGYDNGTRKYLRIWSPGKDSWFGNDYDITMISDYRDIVRVRVFSDPNWPNPGWAGFNVGIFAFSGGQPGSLLWGPKFHKPLRRTPGWVSFSVDWVLPASDNAFVAAMEQFYEYPPNADPHAVDTNPTFIGHSWRFVEDKWGPLTYQDGYQNLMLRVVVRKVNVSVAPTSLGRVKALYY